MNLTNNRKLTSYILASVAIGVAIILVPLVIYPLFIGIGEIQTQKEQASALLAKMNEKNTQINTVKQSLAEYQRQFDNLDLAYPSGKEVPALILGIGKLATENNVTITSFKINPGEIVATGSATRSATPSATDAQVSDISSKDYLTLQLSTSGELQNQKNFLVKLSEIRRLLYLKKIDLNSALTATASGISSGNYEANTIIEVPYGGLPTSLGAVESPLPLLSKQTQELIASLSALPLYTNKLNAAP